MPLLLERDGCGDLPLSVSSLPDSGLGDKDLDASRLRLGSVTSLGDDGVKKEVGQDLSLSPVR